MLQNNVQSVVSHSAKMMLPAFSSSFASYELACLLSYSFCLLSFFFFLFFPLFSPSSLFSMLTSILPSIRPSFLASFCIYFPYLINEVYFSRYPPKSVSAPVVVQPLSRVRLFVTPQTAACQACLSITNSRSLLRVTLVDSLMRSDHLILCHPLLLLPSIFPSIRGFSSY